MTVLPALKVRPHSSIGTEVLDMRKARRVSLAGAWEADYWTHELGVSTGELMRIIGKVGNSVTAIRKELGLVSHENSGLKFKWPSGSTSTPASKSATRII